MADGFIPGLRYRSRAQELWALIVQSFGDWEQRVNEAAAAGGVSPVSAWTLVQLDPDHALSQKELAARLRCNPSTVVDATDRLEEAGLVARSPNPADRRVNNLTVTVRGRKVRDALIGRLFEPPDGLRRLSAGDASRFRDAMLATVAPGAQQVARRAERSPRKRSPARRGA